MLAHVPDKIKKGKTLEPVVVVYHFGLVSPAEIQKFGQLFFYGILVVAEHLLRQQVALAGFPGRVAHHARGAPHQGKWLVPATLKVHQRHDLHEVADVKGIGRRVKAYIPGRGPLFQQVFGARHHIVHHAPPLQFFDKIHLDFKNKGQI